MAEKLLVAHAEGLGNCVQIFPTIRTLKEVLGYDIDYFHAFGHYKIPKICPHVDKWFVGNEIMNLRYNEYVGKVSTKWARDHLNIGDLSKLILYASISEISINKSEIDVYMDIARVLGANEDELLWHSGCLYRQVEEEYDLVIHDGYNKHGLPRDNWHLKSYPYYKEVVSLLGDLKICSVGDSSEWIKGTINKTGTDLLTTLGIIKNSKMLLGNDSGLYHCANALGVDNIVIFTYTSTVKNYDKRFHRYSTILQQEGLDCLSCQNTPRFKTCKTRECREIPPEIVAATVMEMLDGYSV